MNPSGKSRPQYGWSKADLDKMVELIEKHERHLKFPQHGLARTTWVPHNDLDILNEVLHGGVQGLKTIKRPPKVSRKVHPFFNTPLFTK